MRQKSDNENVGPVSEERSAISRLRLLDFDDLFLLSHLLEGATIAATAKQLGLTQPAITQRVRKIERVFGEPLLQKAGRHVRLTKEGRAVCVKATDALALMRAVAAEPQARSLTIGSSAAIAQTLLLPAATQVLNSATPMVCHLHVGSHEDMPSLLESRVIDAWLTAEANASGRLEQLDLGEEDYLFVASRERAGKILEPSALREVLLLEIDKSYPLLTRVDSAVRGALRFRDVWYLGSLSNVLSATLSDQGVAILPGHLVRPYLEVGKLGVILPDIELTPIRLSLIYRRDPELTTLIEVVSREIKRLRGMG